MGGTDIPRARLLFPLWYSRALPIASPHVPRRRQSQPRAIRRCPVRKLVQLRPVTEGQTRTQNPSECPHRGHHPRRQSLESSREAGGSTRENHHWPEMQPTRLRRQQAPHHAKRRVGRRSSYGTPSQTTAPPLAKNRNSREFAGQERPVTNRRRL